MKRNTPSPEAGSERVSAEPGIASTAEHRPALRAAAGARALRSKGSRHAEPWYELHLGNGRHLRVGSRFDLATVRQLMALLASHASAETTPEPSPEPTPETTAAVTAEPKAAVTAEPNAAVSAEPKAAVTAEPKAAVSAEPKAAVTAEPKAAVTAEPKAAVTAEPKAAVTAEG